MAAQVAGHRGFTLIELMVVIGVMGIIFAMTVPAFSKFNASTRFAGVRNTLMVDMRYARAMASAQHRTYRLARWNSGYALISQSPLATVLTRTMPSGVTFASADTTTFYAWGLSQAAAITLQQGGRSSIVRLTSGGQVSHD